MPKNEPQPFGLCEMCEWDTYGQADDEVAILVVLHVLVKHPDQYHRDTGKDPQEQLKKYAVQLNFYRKLL